MRQFLLTGLRSVTKQWIGILALVLALTQVTGAATFITTTVGKLHIAGTGTVIDSTGAPVNLPQQMVLGSWATGDFNAGISSDNFPFLGCTGTAISSCAVSIFSDGVSSPAQVQFDSKGNIYANASGTLNIGTFIAATSVAGINCTNFFFGASASFGTASVPVVCGDTVGDTGFAGNVEAINTEGDFKVLTSGANSATRSYVPPSFTAAGAAVATTNHIVSGSITATTSATCNSNVACSLTGNTITFSGVAVFASSGSYNCLATSAQGSSLFVIPGFSNGSGTTTTLAVENVGSGSIGSSTALVFNYFCIGT